MVMVVTAVALTGCPDTGIVCRTGTNRCGTGCADYASDRRNCGGCGQACAASQVCVATGSDGYQAVIAWGEIDPEFGSQPILVAFERDGETLELPTLVIPGDARGGRYVSGLVNLSLRDAPTVSQ